jgi:Tfp pilus assembly protein PilF
MIVVHRARLGAPLLALASLLVIAWAALVAPAAQLRRLADEPGERVLVELGDVRAARALARLRPGTTGAANDPGPALALARAELGLARRLGDPRHLGYAEAALAPWSRPDGPSEAKLLGAVIAQARHDFTGAAQLLDELLAQRPDDVEALTTRAAVALVVGELDVVARCCTQLAALAASPHDVACEAQRLSRRGEHGRAAELLESAYAAARRPTERAQLASLRAEVAFWSGDDVRAEQAAREALGWDPADRYTRALLADLWLERGELLRVRSLLEGHTADDALLLRDALAARGLGEAMAEPLFAGLAAREAQNRQRGDLSHGREALRLALARGDTGPRLVALARANFASQREPWDARLLAAVAEREGDAEALAAARAWLRDTGFESPRLRLASGATP